MLFPLRDENPASRIPFVTASLIVINTLIMLWLSMLSPREQQIEVIRHGFVPHRIAQLSNPNLVVRVPLADAQQDNLLVGQRAPDPGAVELDPVPSQVLLSLLTMMFLHGGWLHLGGNMWFLWIFGNNVEDRLGPIVFPLFYLVGGLLATACQWAYDPASELPTIGASGAVAAVLGAYAVTFPKAKVRSLLFIGVILLVDIPALAWLVIWFLGELASALLVGKDLGVAVWAHIGGFLAGAILMPLLSFGAPPPGIDWEEEIRRHFTFPSPGR